MFDGVSERAAQEANTTTNLHSTMSNFYGSVHINPSIFYQVLIYLEGGLREGTDYIDVGAGAGQVDAEQCPSYAHVRCGTNDDQS